MTKLLILDTANHKEKPDITPTFFMKTCFVTSINSADEEKRVSLLIESLRRYGGPLQDYPVLIFSSDIDISNSFSKYGNIKFFQLSIEDKYRSFPLSQKVFTCARAEEIASTETQCMIWVSPTCLFINPPVLFELNQSFDAAFRPVHHVNIGSPAREPLDTYWAEIYKFIGIDEAPYHVESYVESQTIRPYFNTHCFSINTRKGIMQTWREIFIKILWEKRYQTTILQDTLHQIFLHQALLSTLIMKKVEKQRILILPPEYSYPLHLHKEIPEQRRLKTLEEIICAVYEEEADIRNIHMDEPIKSWLSKYNIQTK